MNCFKCNKELDENSKYLKCCDCLSTYHLECLSNITDQDYEYIVTSGCAWKCVKCDKKKTKRDDETPVTPLQEKSKFSGKVISPSNSDSDVSENTGVKTKILCLMCKKGFSYNAYRAVCNNCQINFHFKCIKITKEEYFSREKDWLCKACESSEKLKKADSSIIVIENENITLKELLIEMRSFRNEVTKQNKEFTVALNNYSDWIVENGQHVKNIDDKLTTLIGDIDVLRQENCDFKKKNEFLNKRLNVVEQAMRENVIEISGVPYKNDENVIDIVKNISDAIGFAFEENLIDNCYRFKPTAVNSAARPPGIVVRFVRKLDKDNFLQFRRQKRNLNSRDIGFMAGDALVVYVNESLTFERRQLLNAARLTKREKQFTYLWVKGGRIFVRKNQGDRAIVIDTMDDLKNLA